MRLPSSRPSFSSILASAAIAVVPGTARASAPSPDLMTRLAAYAARFETVRLHSSYDVDGRMVTLDGSGNPDSVKEMVCRIDSDGQHARVTVLKYTEDGKDKTAEAQRKAREKADKDPTDEKQILMPMLADQQPRYVFDELEADRADPTRVRIGFVPKVRANDTIEGSAWVDTRAGTLISAGFKLSKNPIFVDYVHITVEFGAPTPLGPAVSTIGADGAGGLLFFRKHFHLTATLSNYRIP